MTLFAPINKNLVKLGQKVEKKLSADNSLGANKLILIGPLTCGFAG
jgi:hypothetical protein